MKTSVLRKLLGLIGIFAISSQLMGQMGKIDGSKYGKGEDSVRCITNLSLFRGYTKNKEYDMAFQFWKIVFDECPLASKNTYLDGVQMYHYFLDKENLTDQHKSDLVDTLMLIYDRRLEYFGQKGKVRGRQGADLLKYRRQDGVKYIQQAYGYLKESVEFEKEKTELAVLPTFLSGSIALYTESAVDAGQVIKDYLMVSEIIDKKIEKSPGNNKLTNLKSSIDENFIKYGPGECEKLIDFFSKEFEEKKEDIAFLTMLTTLLHKRECTSSEFYYEASKALDKLAPSAESSVNIAYWAKSNNLYSDAVDYYLKAIELETNPDKKASYYMGTALAYEKLNSKTKAREYALNAAKEKPGYGEPYILIGQLYASSAKDCGSIKLPGAIYWAAVDMFIKAKSVDPSVTESANKNISTYSKYYPNKEKAFFEGVKEGDTYFIDCWINESTKARF